MLWQNPAYNWVVSLFLFENSRCSDTLTEIMKLPNRNPDRLKSLIYCR
ncbi:hypothetical protein BCF53_12410 [Reinekea marinisedimentorum]|uniref:Uncharacterized protein n=1 Tax=Reinekea marinisedimentorum TaxID=230495 RepID=A0A4R3HTD8_9GAMM|nr:hypothetical protein BCF53_12410 [Reinekea marinisedimentorum]